jgi:hypothetical protein
MISLGGNRILLRVLFCRIIYFPHPVWAGIVNSFQGMPEIIFMYITDIIYRLNKYLLPFDGRKSARGLWFGLPGLAVKILLGALIPYF